ncbi:O-antigen ligase family protein [Pseudarthrobacter oxydans]|uniref:O-antigen ligase family protein n=1 Tax=Pseudarthrobacter oxydans TaxID=1671 RepID=UPI0037FCB1DF
MAILWFVLAFGVDGATVGSKRRLRAGVVIPIYLFGAWIFGVFSFAILTNAWAPDSFVLLAGVIALLVAPIAYFALPPRPSWQVSIERFYRFALCAFAITALIDAYLTPAGMQPVLLGHEKAYLAVIVLAAPKFRGSQLIKLVVIVALGVAFIKYPSATVGFVAIVSLVCVWLLVARNRISQNLRAAGLIVSFGVISYNASDWVAQFYAATGRVDNTNTRLGLWDQALSTITKNPLTGSTASESITGLANIRGIIQPVPFHNSFLTLAFCCGVVAVILFGLILLAIVTSCLSSSLNNRKAAILWLPALLAGVITMSVNPVLEKLGTALPLYALILCAAPLLISDSEVIDLVEDATDD